MLPLEAAVTVLQQLWRRNGPEYREIDERIAGWMLIGMTAEAAWEKLDLPGRCKGWGYIRQVMMGRRRKTKGR